MNLRPQTLQAKHAAVVMHGAPGRELMCDHAPRAAHPVQIQNRIDYLSHIDLARSAAGFGWWYHWFNELPLLIRQVAGIWCSFYILSYRLKNRKLTTSHTRSKTENKRKPASCKELRAKTTPTPHKKTNPIPACRDTIRDIQYDMPRQQALSVSAGSGSV